MVMVFFRTLLLLFPACLWAVDASSYDLSKELMEYIPETDKSMYYLHLLFGGAIKEVSAGNPSGVISQIFYIFNSGILFIIFGFAGFTVINAAMLSATDSTMMKRKIKPMTTFRTITGAMLVAPNSSGYAAIQIMLIKVVILGVGLANGVWHTAVEKIDKMGGRTTLDAPAQMQDDILTLINDGSSGGFVNAYNAAKCVQNKYYSNKMSEERISPSNYGVWLIEGDSPKVGFGWVANKTACGTLSPPANLKDSDKRDVANAILMSSLIILNSVTEQYQYGYSRELNTANKAKKESMYKQICTSGSSSMCLPAAALVSAAMTYNSATLHIRMQTKGKAANFVAQSEKDGWISAGQYFHKLANNGIEGFTTEDNYDGVKYKAISKVMPQWKAGQTVPDVSGLGAYVIDTKSLVNDYRSIITDIYDANKTMRTEKSGDFYDYEDGMRLKTVWGILTGLVQEQDLMSGMSIPEPSGVLAAINNWLKLGLFVGYQNLNRLLVQSIEAFTGVRMMKDSRYGAGNWNDVRYNSECYNMLWKCRITSGPYTCASKVLSGPSSCLSYDWRNVGLLKQLKNEYLIEKAPKGSTPPSPINPFIAMVMTGQQLVKSAMGYWHYNMNQTTSALLKLMWLFYFIKLGLTVTAASAIFFAVSPPGPICIPCAVGIGYVYMTFMGPISLFQQQAAYAVTIPNGIGNSLAMIVYSIGNFMGFFIPFIPVVTYTLAVVGWLMLVIEAMIAAPLVALGLTNPQGHDYLGMAQQSVMMFTATMLRPAVIVISYFIALNLVVVGFKYLNYIVISIIPQWIVFIGSEYVYVISSILAMMLVYTYFSFALMMQILETINDIPDKILRWIGGTMLMPGGNIRQLLSEAKGGFGGAMDSAGRGAGQSMSKITGAMSQTAGTAGPSDGGVVNKMMSGRLEQLKEARERAKEKAEKQEEKNAKENEKQQDQGNDDPVTRETRIREDREAFREQRLDEDQEQNDDDQDKREERESEMSGAPAFDPVEAEMIERAQMEALEQEEAQGGALAEQAAIQAAQKEAQNVALAEQAAIQAAQKAAQRSGLDRSAPVKGASERGAGSSNQQDDKDGEQDKPESSQDEIKADQKKKDEE